MCCLCSSRLFWTIFRKASENMASNVWISFSVAQKLSETSGFNAGSCFSISETIRWKNKKLVLKPVLPDTVLNLLPQSLDLLQIAPPQGGSQFRTPFAP